MKKKIITLLLFILAMIMCFPIVFLLSGSIMGAAEIKEYLGPVLNDGSGYVTWSVLPKYATLRSYVELLLDTPKFFVMFWNSVGMTVSILIGQLVVSVTAAWGFARYEFPYKKLLFTLYIVLMLMPFQVTMLSTYLVLDKIKLINTAMSIVLPAVFSTFPVFIMYRFFISIPESIIECARLDGASEFKIFIKIGIPLGKPGTMSAMILGFLEYWNLIEQPLTFLKDKSLWPLSLYLPSIGLESADVAFAASAVTLITAIIVFFAGQSHLEQGIVATAVKE